MRNWVFIILALLLSACARSPQQVEYRSGPVETALNPGDAVISRISVVDGRSSTVIGSRGGAYRSTSVITLDEGALTAMRTYIQAKLLEAGFGFETTSSQSRWEVRLSELRYEVSEASSIKDKVEVTCELELTIILPDETTYTNSYLGLVAEEVIGLPSDDKNAAIINRAINSAMSAMLTDTGISRFYQ